MLKMNRYLKKREKILISILVLLLITACFYYITFVMQADYNAQLAQSYNEKKAGLDKVNNYLASNPDIESTIARLNEKEKMLEIVLPVSNNFTTVLQDLTKLSYETKVRLIKVQPVEVTPNNGYIETMIDVELNGDYFSILKFIKTLEDKSQFYNIRKLTLQKKENDRNNLLTASLGVAIYNLGKN